MDLTRREREMLDGVHGEPLRIAMDALVQLGEAYDARDMVEIGYAHIHAGMALYLGDVELMEALAEAGATVSVPASANIANADMGGGNPIGAPESLVALQTRAEAAHGRLGSACAFTCTPYWAGFWPTWNMHMASIESTVTVFCNSVLGARSNRDGFFAVYAAIAGRYPRFGYHLDENRVATHRVRVETTPAAVSDFSCLGFHIGRAVGDGVPVLTGLDRRPSLDELDALGAGMATAGGVALFIIPGVTPPYAEAADALPPGRSAVEVAAGAKDIAAVYGRFSGPADAGFDVVHLGCPHASFAEMGAFARLLDGRRVKDGIALWVTTSRAVREAARDAGFVATIEEAGGRVVSDTCPMSTHFARTTSPDPALGVTAPDLRGIVVNSAKQAKYLKDMVPGAILLTGSAEAVESAVTGRFVARRGNRS